MSLDNCQKGHDHHLELMKSDNFILHIASFLQRSLKSKSNMASAVYREQAEKIAEENGWPVDEDSMISLIRETDENLAGELIQLLSRKNIGNAF